MKRKPALSKQEDAVVVKRSRHASEVKSEIKTEPPVVLSSPEPSNCCSPTVDSQGETESDAQKARAKAIGRAMVKLLRYQVDAVKLENRQEGEHWIQVRKAIIGINHIVRKSIAEFNCTEEDIQNEVETSVHKYNGPRFELLISGPLKWVRARNVDFYRERRRHCH